MDPRFWLNKRVFLTGHTGFKGSWLSIWLQSLGAKVQGFALAPPTTPSLFEEARVASGMASALGDVRDSAAVMRCMVAFRPEIIFHLAAQPLVRFSYRDPVLTYATNVMGTVHVLEAARHLDSLRCIVNVTTDKCYENQERSLAYREDDALGGYDPYSNSKACSELVTSSYRQSFFQQTPIALASARAGNVIGGGDWAADRLVPDLLRALERNTPAVVRNPQATRPWQHVLEPLSGYLVLAQQLWSQGQSLAEAWNFGPWEEDTRPVQWIAERVVQRWGGSARWQADTGKHPHETTCLRLDISKARERLGWQPRWTLDAALDRTVAWHLAWRAHKDLRVLCQSEIEQYMNTAPGKRS